MYAIIDCGTNTFHLMIAAVINGQIKVYHREQIPVKIGEQGINQGILAKAAYQRGIDALGSFAITLSEYPVQAQRVFGTSAIRDAQNGNVFIKEVQNRFGLKIEAIDGDREAELIYTGVIQAIGKQEEPILVMDIGGGSVEFIIGRNSHILWKRSYPIGAARLLARFQQHDPIHPKEIQAVNHYLDNQLSDLLEVLHNIPVKTMVGAAGSFETLCDVLNDDLDKPVVRIGENAWKVPATDFHLFHDLMLRLNLKERRALKGMLDFRADMIVVSSLLMKYVLNKLQPDDIRVSAYSLKEGMLLDLTT